MKGTIGLLISRTKPQRFVTTDSSISSSISSFGVLHASLFFFHTQTVHWRRRTIDNDNGSGDDDEEAAESCQLLTFRPLDSNSNSDKPITAFTANDTTRSTTALRCLRTSSGSSGQALVYDGGDYHNARQLLQAVKRKIVGTYGRQKRRQKTKETTQIHAAVNKPSTNNTLDLGDEWMKQRRLQREQAELVHKILIQVSLEENSTPSRILGLKRTPANAKEIFAYAFQNDEVKKIHRRDGTILISLAEFVAMVGGYEWNKKGVFVRALQGYIVPHFGVFPPTRQDYLQLMDHVLLVTNAAAAAANGTKRFSRTRPIRLMEIGIGSGVLSLILLKRSIVDRVIGTDINPYAVACAKENMQRFGFASASDLMLTDLFPPTTMAATNDEGCLPSEGRKVDVVLFNPPWVPGDDAATWLDKSVYDPDQSLLRRFLLQVRYYVKDDGRIYLLLSNLGMLLGLFRERQLYALFEEGNLELVEVRATECKAETARRRRRMERTPDLDGIESVKAQEIISLYHLRVKK